MALIISVDVYDFRNTNNELYKKTLMGLPVEGAFVEAATSPDPRIFCYSSINYPALGLGAPAYLTAETVAQILTKMNA